MAKRKQLTEAEIARQIRAGVKSIGKYHQNRLSSETLRSLKKLEKEITRKRKITEKQKQEYERIKQQAQKEKEIAEQKAWKFRQQASERQLERQTAQKVMQEIVDINKNIKSPQERKKAREAVFSKYEADYAKQLQSRIEQIKDYEYKVQYREYDVTKKEEMLRRFLGIGSRGVTLSDGTTFTQDEFNAVLERHNIPIDKFVEDEDIRKERYTQVKYQNWQTKIASTIDEVLNLPDLSDREREGLRKMFKKYGT